MEYIVRQKYSAWGAPGGGSPKMGRQNFFERCLRNNFNCGQDTNDEDIIFLVKQISDNLKNTLGQNYLVAYLRLPITAL